MNSGIKSLFLFVFAHKKYSRRLIYLRLSHCSHLDYINDLFNNFSGPASLGHLVAAYGGVRQGSDFIKNIFICVLKMNEGLTRLEQHEVCGQADVFKTVQVKEGEVLRLDPGVDMTEDFQILWSYESGNLSTCVGRTDTSRENLHPL